MENQAFAPSYVSNFAKKHEPTLLIQQSVGASAELTLTALEEMRVARVAVSASKHGLEVICGASCETGAQ